jgi:lactose/L-arabinose transport system ATP-binding protein
MGFLKIDNVVKKWGEHTVINGVSLEAREGEFVVFVGPSGCGKSTLLRLVAGLDEVTDGSVHIDNADVTEVQPADRRVAMVFQSYALYPHMTVRQNMSFGLKMIKTPQPEIDRLVKDAANILKLDVLLERRPKELSGGQRQRVAIGRAIVRKPKLFLFDEPLSNLDAELRGEMRVEIARLHRELGVTMVYVTHDQVEAMTLADRIVVLRAGQVEQIGTPAELYDWPVNTFVAGFIGSPKMNFVPVTVMHAEGRMVRVSHPSLQGEPELQARGAANLKAGDKVTLGVRPEHLAFGADLPLVLTVQSEYIENLGGLSQLYAKTAAGEAITVQAKGRHQTMQGENLKLSADLAQVYLFDEKGMAI